MGLNYGLKYTAARGGKTRHLGEGVHYYKEPNKWVVKVKKENINNFKGGTYITTLAQFNTKDEADLCYQNYLNSK